MVSFVDVTSRAVIITSISSSVNWRAISCNAQMHTIHRSSGQPMKRRAFSQVWKKKTVRVRRRFGWLHSEQSLKRGAAAIASSMECKSQWSWVQPDLAGRHHIPGNVKPSVPQISFPTHLRSNAWRGRVSEITASSFPPSPLLCTHIKTQPPPPPPPPTTESSGSKRQPAAP